MGKGRRVREARKVKVDGRLVEEKAVVRPDGLPPEVHGEWAHCCEVIAATLAEAMLGARRDDGKVDFSAAKLLFSQSGAIREAKDGSAIIDADFGLRFGSTYRKVRALVGRQLRAARKGA